MNQPPPYYGAPPAPVPPVPVQPSPADKADKMALASLILGLASIACCFFTGIPAVILGLLARSTASPTGKRNATIGIAVGAALSALTVLIMVVAGISSHMEMEAKRKACQPPNVLQLPKGKDDVPRNYECLSPEAANGTASAPVVTVAPIKTTPSSSAPTVASVSAPKSDADCKMTPDCAQNGRCSIDAASGKCVASDEGCAATSHCKEQGMCSAVGPSPEQLSCGAKSAVGCKNSSGCKEEGACSFKADPTGGGACVTGSAADCIQSSKCKEGGLCSFVEGGCKIGSSADCRRTDECKTSGHCTFLKTEGCVVKSDADCAQSKACREDKQCSRVGNSCEKVLRAGICGLYSEYKSNEVAADKKYKGEKVLVLCTVARVRKGWLGGIHVECAGGCGDMDTNPEMDIEGEGAEKLQVGQSVTAACSVGGYALGILGVSDCKLQ